MSSQADLFGGVPPLPEGFRYRLDFLSAAEEAELLEAIRALSLQQAQYKQWSAKRRVMSYGGRYDFDDRELLPAEPVPEFLLPLRAHIAEWIGVDAARFDHALIAEYRPGTQLGWHRDVPNFEAIAGVSLFGRARMRLRPYPPRVTKRAALALDLAPRSAYAMIGPARWDWQHAISPTKDLRYSITFRTLARSN